ncbi:MAG TPA: histidine kinase, partial [Candidatus Merdiplasma excrementigallinarum]|nr:histidine kinase [Candidatus Merdiplasma excrementigallinarum]
IMLSQIQPHFLYNSLGTIHHLCGVDPEKAREAVMEFSKFLRGNMESLKARKPIPFARELGHTKNYLYLEKQRFQERLEIVYDIREMDFLIPPLTLRNRQIRRLPSVSFSSYTEDSLKNSNIRRSEHEAAYFTQWTGGALESSDDCLRPAPGWPVHHRLAEGQRHLQTNLLPLAAPL